MKNMQMKWLLAATVLLAVSGAVRADAKSKAIQEVAEEVMARFGSKAGKSLPALAEKIEGYVGRYGEDALVAIRRVGPDAFALVDEAGVNGPRAVKVLATYGEEGATNILRRPKAMSQFARFGDDAGAVLVKHPAVAESLIERGGPSGVKALEAVTTRNGRRVAMVMEGDLGKVPRSTELLDVIAKYGDRAAEFVWENKGALAVGTALAAFIANPEPFLNGTTQLAKVAGETAAKPLAEGAARGANWTVVILAVLAVVVGMVLLLAVKFGLLGRPAAATTIALSVPPVSEGGKSSCP